MIAGASAGGVAAGFGRLRPRASDLGARPRAGGRPGAPIPPISPLREQTVGSGEAGAGYVGSAQAREPSEPADFPVTSIERAREDRGVDVARGIDEFEGR